MTAKKKGATRLFVLTLLILLLCSSLASLAWAAPEDNESQTSPEEYSTETSDGPTLYASEEEDNPLLIQGNDDAADPAENDSTKAAEDINTEDEPNLIAPRSTSDDTAAKIGAAALAAGMAIVAAVAVFLNHKKQAT